MKTADEYIDESQCHDSYIPYGQTKEIHDPECSFCGYESEVEKIIQQAQYDAINETLKLVSKELNVEDTEIISKCKDKLFEQLND